MRLYSSGDKSIKIYYDFQEKDNWTAKSCTCRLCMIYIGQVFLSIWVFFQVHSHSTRQQGKRETIYITPLYHFHPLHRHLDISRAVTAESSPLHIAGSRTRFRTQPICVYTYR